MMLYESGWSTLHTLEGKPNAHQFQMTISPKLQEIARHHHRKSTQEVEKPPCAKFQNCCRCCRVLQDVARLNNFSNWSRRIARPPPLNSQPSFTSENGNIHFSKFLCNVARSRAIARNAAKTRYNAASEAIIPPSKAIVPPSKQWYRLPKWWCRPPKW